MTSQAGRSAASRAAARVAAATAILVFAACKGGGSNDPSGPLPCTNISFTRALSSPGNGDVYFAPVTAACASVDVAVDIANLSGIYTVGFDFTYPSSVISYQRYSLGPLLQKGNPPNPPFVLVQSAGPGEVQVTMTLLAPDPSVSVSGSDVLIIFHFAKVASGSGPIDFDSGSSSQVTEKVLGQDGTTLAASFGPGHGGTVLVP